MALLQYSDQHFCYHQWCPTTIAEGGKLMRANGKTMLVKAAAFHTLPLLCATTRRRVALPLDVKGLQPHQVAIATQLPRALPTRHPTITYHHPILISSTSRRPTTTEKTWRVWGKKRNDRQEDEVWVMLYFFNFFMTELSCRCFDSEYYCQYCHGNHFTWF